MGVSLASAPASRFYKIVVAFAILSSLLFLAFYHGDTTIQRVTYKPEVEVVESDAKPVETPAPAAPVAPVEEKEKTSKLHYIISATKSKAPVCAGVISAMVNRYSPPMVLGWKGKGKFDAKRSHLAKLYTLQKYLHGPAGDNPDDLAIVVDGFDVVAQLPAEALIERYFELMAKADKRVADRFSITVEEARERDLYHTLIYGVDKGCFPPVYNQAQCWAIPSNPLRENMYPPKVDGYSNPYGARIERLFPAVADFVSESDAKSWIQKMEFKTNLYTKQIYGLFHNTCAKSPFMKRYRDFWFYPYVELLLRAAVKANRNEDKEPINSRLIDGRWWVAANHYAEDLNDDLGGVFTDAADESFIPFMSFCGEWSKELFKKEPHNGTEPTEAN